MRVYRPARGALCGAEPSTRTGGPRAPIPVDSRGVPPRRYVRLALTAALAVSVIAAVPAAGAVAAPAKPSHRLAPPKAHAPEEAEAERPAQAPPATARASLCSAPLVGDWRNIANTNAMTRALVSFTCSDVILCDTNGHCTGGDSYYSTQMFGKCWPTDCNWGTRYAPTRRYDGWIKSTYNFGFKTSSRVAEDVQLLRSDVSAGVGLQRLHACRRPHGLHDRRVVPALATALAARAGAARAVGLVWADGPVEGLQTAYNVCRRSLWPCSGRADTPITLPTESEVLMS